MNNRRTKDAWFICPGEPTLQTETQKLQIFPGHPKWSLFELGGAVGLVGGPLVAAVGFLFLLIDAGLKLGGRGTNSILQTIGTVLLVSIIPLVMLGAHCLDKLDERITNNLRRSPTDAHRLGREPVICP